VDPLAAEQHPRVAAPSADGIAGGDPLMPPTDEAPTEDSMAILTEDMKRVVREQRLGFYATVCEDGSPNLSPKATTYVWDDDHLFFADVRSPHTVSNIRRGSLVEVNVVDPFVRKGYRFKGPAVVYPRGTSLCADGLEWLRETGSTLVDRVKAIVVIEVREASAVVSPAYDDGFLSEADMIRTFQARFARLHPAASS
jgi:predicted pyridoxine 5'-phosphate oxidase superfamily flavin-nucleotide-binding protein